MFLPYDTVDTLHAMLLKRTHAYEYDNIIEMFNAQIFLWSLILFYFSTLLFYCDGDENYYHFLMLCYVFNVIKHYKHSWRGPLQPKSMRTSLLILVSWGHTWTELYFHIRAFQTEERLSFDVLISQLLSTIISKNILYTYGRKLKQLLPLVSTFYFTQLQKCSVH